MFVYSVCVRVCACWETRTSAKTHALPLPLLLPQSAPPTRLHIWLCVRVWFNKFYCVCSYTHKTLGMIIRILVVGGWVGIASICSVLQCVAVCCSVLQGVAGCCCVMQYVAVYRSGYLLLCACAGSHAPARKRTLVRSVDPMLPSSFTHTVAKCNTLQGGKWVSLP